MISRLAPTPSGFLHRGNCLNFLVTDALVRSHGGTLALRIDDMDADRYRAEYVDDIFRVLAWLDIEWQVGPRDTTDFETSFALRDRTVFYRAEMEELRGSPLETYACACSRSELRQAGSLTCVSECRQRNLPLEPGRTALRVHVPDGTEVVVEGRPVALSATMGDVIVWRRDDLPAYQLASVIEDRDLGTTHIVRGDDLLESSAMQVFLAPALGATSVADARYIHHPLLVDSRGDKLSKSNRTEGPMQTTPELLAELRSLSDHLMATLDVA